MSDRQHFLFINEWSELLNTIHKYMKFLKYHNKVNYRTILLLSKVNNGKLLSQIILI